MKLPGGKYVGGGTVLKGGKVVLGGADVVGAVVGGLGTSQPGLFCPFKQQY